MPPHLLQPLAPHTTTVQPTITADLLLESSSALQKPKGTLLLPHQFITRGDSCKPKHRGWSILQLFVAEPPTLPSQAFLQALFKHEEELAIMAISWDWPTCRCSSEKTFKLIGEGRVRDCWNNHIVIKDIQQDVCTEAVQVLQARAAPAQQSEFLRQQTSTSSQQH